MMHNHEIPGSEGSPDSQSSNHCERCGKDLSFVAYIIGASVLIGAILISASLFYNFRQVLKRMETGGTVAMAGTAGSGLQPAAPSAPSAVAPGTPVKITLPSNVPYLGSGSAKVTVVEYADYQCPFCEQFYKNVWPDLKAKYVDTGKIKFVYQDFAFLGADSNTLAEGAHCAADQNKFWQYHDYIFSNQQQENTGWATPPKVKVLAAAAGLNATQFNQCLDSGKYTQEVLNETAAGKGYGVSGTPTVFINGTPVVGAQPALSFEQVIDAALK